MMALRAVISCALLDTCLALRRSSRKAAFAPAPAPAGSFLQYYRTADHNLLAENMPQCNFFSAEDIGKVVPDACCDPSAWPASVPLITQGPDTRLHIGGDTTDRCYARERVPAPGTYVRNFFGCYQGEITAYEECVPDGLGLGKGYPMNESIAVKSGVDGDPESCNCGTPYVGQGCFVAASGFSAGISPDPTANFLKVSGNCDEGSLSLQQTREQEGSKKNDPLVSSNPQCSWRSPIPAPTPPETPTPAPPTKGYTGPPKNPGMTYMGVGDITEIADYNPECVSSFCDETIGTKMPDRCCDIDSWRNAAGDLPPSWWGGDGHESDILYMPDDPNKSPVTCYSRVAPGPFDGMVTGGYVQWIRNYIGCENGELHAHENCVPGGVEYVTPEQFAQGNCTADSCPWTYPMTREKGIETFENGTGESCHCSKLSHFKHGPGCYIAFATLAQYVGMYPAVFVQVDGTCEGP